MNLLLIIGLSILIALPFLVVNTAIPIYLFIEKRRNKNHKQIKKSKK